MFKAVIWCTVKHFGVMGTSCMSQLSPCQQGERAQLPHTTVIYIFQLSSLSFWVFTAPTLSGSWLSIMGEVGWLRSFFWPGSARFLQTTQTLSPDQRSSSHNSPKILSPCPGSRYHCCSCSPQPCSQMLAGSSP